MIQFDLAETLYIRVITMDANGMMSRLGTPPGATPEFIASAASKWADDTAEMLKDRPFQSWKIFIEMITLPTTDLESRLGPHNDFREPLLRYVDRLRLSKLQ